MVFKLTSKENKTHDDGFQKLSIANIKHRLSSFHVTFDKKCGVDTSDLADMFLINIVESICNHQ
jgi:hypothetical protein